MEQVAGGTVETTLLSSEQSASVFEPGIPDKLYFRTGEVARLAALKPYVLRFWESEFPTLGPKKSDTGHRLYRRKDVETVLEIKRLLYEKRFTIEGARKVLDSQRPRRRRERVEAQISECPPEQQGQLFAPSSALLADLKRELSDILALLK
jgi:DNA-binding transcriptional MerR regulator